MFPIFSLRIWNVRYISDVKLFVLFWMWKLPLWDILLLLQHYAPFFFPIHEVWPFPLVLSNSFPENYVRLSFPNQTTFFALSFNLHNTPRFYLVRRRTILPFSLTELAYLSTNIFPSPNSPYLCPYQAFTFLPLGLTFPPSQFIPILPPA